MIDFGKLQKNTLSKGIRLNEDTTTEWGAGHSR